MIEKFKWLKNKKYKIKIGNFWEATEGFRSTMHPTSMPSKSWSRRKCRRSRQLKKRKNEPN